MAKLVMTDVFVSIEATDVSAYVESVTLEYSADQVPVTAMGDGTHLRVGGLKDWSVSITAQNDFAASALDSLLFPLVGALCSLIIRPVKGTVVGTGNPNYTGEGLLTGYSPAAGGVGELAKTPINFVAGGPLTRATS